MTKNLQQLPLPFPPLNSSNPNPDQSRTKIVWIRRLENRRIYAPFEYLKLRNWMIGRLLRCFFIIIIRHRRRRSCLPTGNCFDLRFTFLCIYGSFHIIQHTTYLFGFLFFRFFRHPCLFQIETLLVIFLFLIRFGSTRISLNRHSASSTFYPTLVILDAFDHDHSTSILSITKYLELLGLFSCLSG